MPGARRRGRAVRTCEKKGVPRRPAGTLSGVVEPPPRMMAPREGPGAPCHMRPAALEPLRAPGRVSLQRVWRNRPHPTPSGAHSGVWRRSANARRGAPAVTVRVAATRSRDHAGRRWAGIAEDTGGATASGRPGGRPDPETHAMVACLVDTTRSACSRRARPVGLRCACGAMGRIVAMGCGLAPAMRVPLRRPPRSQSTQGSA